MRIKYYTILILITVAGALLRFHKIDASPWADEIVSLLLIRDGSWGDAFSSFKSANNHLLYTVLTKLLISVTGDNIYTFRAIPLITGIASIPAVFYLGNLIRDKRIGLISAFFTAFSFTFIHYSQECRGYSGSVFFSIVSTFIFIKMISGGTEKRLPFFYALSIIAGALFHLMNLSILMAHVITTLFIVILNRLPDKRGIPGLFSFPPSFFKKYFMLVAVIFILIGLAFLPLLSEVSSTFDYFTASPKESANLLTWQFLLELFGYPFGLPFNVVAVVLLFVIMAFALYNQFKVTPEFFIFTIILFTVPILLYRIANPAHVIQGVLPPRFFIHFFPFIYILIAIGITEIVSKIIENKSIKNSCIYLTVFLFIIPNLVIERNYFENGRQHWKEIFEYIYKNAKKGDIITTNGTVGRLAHKYFNKYIAFEKRDLSFVSWPMLYFQKKDTEKWLIYIGDSTNTYENAYKLYNSNKVDLYKKDVFFETEFFSKVLTFMGYEGHSSSNAYLYHSPGAGYAKDNRLQFSYFDKNKRKFEKGLKFFLRDLTDSTLLASGFNAFPGLHGISGIPNNQEKKEFVLHEEGIIRSIQRIPVIINIYYRCGLEIRFNGTKLVADLKNKELKSVTISTQNLPVTGVTMSLEYVYHSFCGEPLLNFFLKNNS